MALLEILEYPDPRLRTVAVRIDKVDDALRTLALDMIETMYEAPGIGLAASQINVHRRLVVIDVSEQQDAPLILINPEYVVTGAPMEYQEGCLSVPGYYENVTRFDKIQVSALKNKARPWRLRPPTCWPSASNMRSIIWMASCLSITCPA